MTAVELDPGACERQMVARGLHEWAENVPEDRWDRTVAAVDLATKAYDRYLIDPGWPWVKEGDGVDDTLVIAAGGFGLFHLDPAAMATWADYSGPLRLLPLIESLLSRRRIHGLPRLLMECDTATRGLILDAFDLVAARDRAGALRRFGGDVAAILDSLIVDRVAVRRFLEGQPVKLNHAERLEVTRRWVDAGWPLSELEQATGWNVARYRREILAGEPQGVAWC
jgi:hypothetical protein